MIYTYISSYDRLTSIRLYINADSDRFCGRLIIQGMFSVEVVGVVISLVYLLLHQTGFLLYRAQPAISEKANIATGTNTALL